MKRLFNHALLLLALMVFTAACSLIGVNQEAGAGVSSAVNPASTLSRITERGELVLGTSGNMPPMTEALADGKVVGFDIDMARLMASGMNVKLSIKVLPFDQLLPALERGDVDVVISNLTMTPERNLHAAFVGPYMTSGKCVITRKAALAEAEKAADINVPETRLAALAGSTSADFVKTLLPRATLTLVQSNEAGVGLITDNKVDGMMADYPVCLSILQRHPDAGFVSLMSLLNYEPIGIAVPANDTLFINWTGNFLQRLQGVGLFEELSKRWFGTAVVTGGSE
jgi:polar amino acid transport system substrate-binding protein